MKRLNHWLNNFRPVQKMYAALGRHPEFGVRESGGRPEHTPPPARLVAETPPPPGVSDADWRAFVRRVTAGRGDDRAAAWVLSGLAAEGVKVFAPTAAEFTALTKIALNIGWADYRQPFDTFAVLVPDEVASGMAVGGRPPVAVLSRVGYDGRALAMIAVTSDPDHAAHSLTCWPADGDTSIEETFSDHEETEIEGGEMSTFDACRRAAINACLALTQFGTRRLGYDNPEYAGRLTAKMSKRGLPEKVREANRAAMLLIPEAFGISQDVALHDTEGGCGESGAGDGRGRKPHWRRGHWARTACGAGHADRRLVFRRPTMINSHHFRGDRGTTVAAYHTA